jgi:hypothetical protein
MTTTLLDRPAPAGTQGWPTSTLRPAGEMTPAAADRFTAALAALAGCSAVVVVDLSASGPLPRRARRALADADAALTATGGALLLDRGRPPVPLPPIAE